MDLNFDELKKDWEDRFFNGDWSQGTLEYTETEKKIIEELSEFLPRHMYFYDWNLPYAEKILLIFRRHLNKKNRSGETKMDFACRKKTIPTKCSTACADPKHPYFGNPVGLCVGCLWKSAQ